MFSTRLLAVVALVGLAAAPVLAQTTAPATPARPVLPAPAAKPPAILPPVAKAPVAAPTAAAPATATPTAAASTTTPVAKVPASTASSATLVNLNTATPAQLDALPEVGKARAKAIVAERTKGAFKNWPDFDSRMAGTSINAGVKAKIKDRVTF